MISQALLNMHPLYQQLAQTGAAPA